MVSRVFRTTIVAAAAIATATTVRAGTILDGGDASDDAVASDAADDATDIDAEDVDADAQSAADVKRDACNPFDYYCCGGPNGPCGRDEGGVPQKGCACSEGAGAPALPALLVLGPVGLLFAMRSRRKRDVTECNCSRRR